MPMLIIYTKDNMPMLIIYTKDNMPMTSIHSNTLLQKKKMSMTSKQYNAHLNFQQ